MNKFIWVSVPLCAALCLNLSDAYRNFVITANNNTDSARHENLYLDQFKGYDNHVKKMTVQGDSTPFAAGSSSVLTAKSVKNNASGYFTVCKQNITDPQCTSYCRYKYDINSLHGYSFSVKKSKGLICSKKTVTTKGKDDVLVQLHIGDTL